VNRENNYNIFSSLKFKLLIWYCKINFCELLSALLDIVLVQIRFALISFFYTKFFPFNWFVNLILILFICCLPDGDDGGGDLWAIPSWCRRMTREGSTSAPPGLRWRLSKSRSYCRCREYRRCLKKKQFKYKNENSIESFALSSNVGKYKPKVTV
jgi:hypothetical protein